MSAKATGCWVCLEDTERPDRYHTPCLKRLFGRPSCPRVDLGSTTLNEAIAAQSDRISISGVQSKLVVELTDDGKSIRPAESGSYILKVPVDSYKFLPENEQLTMAMAKMAGLVVPDFGLVALPDDRLAYVVRRFDRTDGRVRSKRRQEDFCSLTQHDPSQKYHATAEDCAEVVRRYSTEADGDLRRLFRQFLFAFWAGNDDLHLKNLSLAQRGSRGYALSPAYDLVCTRLYPQLKKGMALSLAGVKLHQQRSHFITFGASCGISIEEAHAEIDRMLGMREEIEKMIGCSPLPRPFQLAYKRALAKKSRSLHRL
jgi:serine/threonine-protein kinase HipA